MLLRPAIILSTVATCLATRDDWLKIRDAQDLAAQAASIGPAKISSLVPTSVVAIEVPKSLQNDILTAVQPSILLSLLDLDYRTQVASEFHAGNTPGWYETIKPDVKSFFAQFVQHKETFVTSKPESPGESATSVQSSLDVETAIVTSVNTEASTYNGPKPAQPSDSKSTASGEFKPQESTDTAATVTGVSKPQKSDNSGATASGYSKIEKSSNVEAATSGTVHANASDVPSVTATGSSQPSDSVKVAALESEIPDNAHSDSTKAAALDGTSAANVKTTGVLESEQAEPSASTETGFSSEAPSGSGSSALGALETSVSDHATGTEISHATSERGTQSTAIGTKLSHQASGVPSASGFKLSSSHQDNIISTTGSALKTGSLTKSGSASGAQVKTTQSAAIAMPTGVHRLTVVGVVGMAGFLGVMMAF
ncbi:unnamed protein product [Clonostachys solani]|uniref:Uncharacterized protein n=1 Tax=Clonostachys solani TaxID=160281 RepID=A0A9N9W2D8_9HYPO|nr:unnamed protein product [Clonostachys solani]